MYMIEQVTGHTFEYDKIHKALKIVVDLPETGIPPAGPGKQQLQLWQMHLPVVHQQEELPFRHVVLTHVLPQAMVVLPHLSVSSSVPSLECAKTFRLGSGALSLGRGRRGWLGGRTLGL